MPTHVRYDKERQNQANKFKAEDVQAGDPRHDIQKIQSNTKHPYSKTKKKKGSVERGRKRRNKGGTREEKRRKRLHPFIISPTTGSARGLAWRDGWFDDLVSDG